MKKGTICIIIVVLLIAVFFLPKAVLAEKGDVAVSVYVETEAVTLTEEQTAQIIALLRDAKMIRSFSVMPIASAEDYPLEINLGDNGTIKHLIFGKQNLCQIGNRRFVYTILNGAEVFEKISAVICE